MRHTWLRRRACSILLNVEFEEELDVQLFVRGEDARAIRLVTGVRLAVGGQWSIVFPAVIDTGSPDCAIPHAVWSMIDYGILVPQPLALGGIGGGHLKAPLGEVTLAVDDGIRTSPPLAVRAFLLPDDSVPLLLGFQDFLTRVTLHCDYPHRSATLKFPMEG